MKILVTGATGFVGSAVARCMLAAGHEVVALVRPTSNRFNLRELGIGTIEGDLTEEKTLVPALAGCRALFHVAADYRLWAPDPSVLYRTNVDGTVALMRAALQCGLDRIVYTSSVATLGLTGTDEPADERTPVTFEDMIGHYKKSKYLAEEAVRDMTARDGLPCVIVNPSTPIGPRDIRPTPSGRMILEAALGRMPAYSAGGLNFVHVDDCAQGHLLAYDKGEIGERYILGGENMSIKEILHRLSAITGKRPPLFRAPAALTLPLAYASQGIARLAGGDEPMITVEGVKLSNKKMYFSSDKARRLLGYDPAPIDRALRDAIDWFAVNGYL